ncbi:TnsA endonuclease N-terminal domain-containing protein [Endozoicomonas gorgoniicola]|uniref:TnsA endonuclease N-terminal domain-containing protein n=1 Tax=Endozoicomonas gorgoniicola TaxID=1234144 RepID=A0ABT3N411_9GAMM|nr:TnsA endonuclease N-terminal domain-containing protein [Endozoicomonas gorgoniicola]MCW7556368.1 TnsA endonuclease N-terminal domain-containing protein [Endozoicomonas gorgoniicola]
MPKKVNKFSPYSRSEKQLQRWIKEEKRGTGHGRDYIPGLNTNEIPSAKEDNFKARVSGIKSLGRDVQLGSHTEHKIFRPFDLAKNVVEIREQFPLKREKTLAIAEKLKINHPSELDYNTNKPFAIEMTTDLLVTMIDEDSRKFDIAVSVKPAHKLLNKRVLEKQKIEYVYWLLKGVPFFIITDLSLDVGIDNNLELIHQNYCSATQNHLSLPENTNIGLIEQHIISGIRNTSEDLTISELCKKINDSHGCAPGVALTIFFRMIAVRIIDVDMTKLSTGPLTEISALKKYLG